MKQTMASKNEWPLLTYAISKLNPEVFSHPVWIRFGMKEKILLPGIVEDIIKIIPNIQDDSPGNSCQLMLICAVYQSQTDQYNPASTTIQQVLAIAKQAGLASEILWAYWGLCAICIQQGHYDQAASHLDDLQSALNGQNEWVLADFVDVIKQYLHLQTTSSQGWQPEFSNAHQFDDLILFTFKWLQHWGISTQSLETGYGVIPKVSGRGASIASELTRSIFSVRHWRDYWHTLKLILKGQLKLHWVEDDVLGVKRKTTPIRSVLRSLRLPQPGRKIETQTARDVPQIPSVTFSEPAKAGYSPDRSSTASKLNASYRQNPGQTTSGMPMTVQMLGTFNITIQDYTLKLPASRGLSMLKFMLLHHKQDTPRDVLMDIFWPDAEPEAARNNLNVAMHGLRQSLRSVTDLVIRFEDGAYGLEPNLEVWLDVEEFDHCVKEGQRLEADNQLTAAVAEYEIAINLYRGDFLADNPYESWTVLDRERLRIAYMDTLDHLSQIYFSQERYTACVNLCQLILSRDLCREDAHCRLMQCYSRLGQGPLALRQYQICLEALRAELDVDPAPETTRLYERVRRHEHA